MGVIGEKYTSQRSTDIHLSLAFLTKLWGLLLNIIINYTNIYICITYVYIVSNISTDIHMFINTHTYVYGSFKRHVQRFWHISHWEVGTYISFHLFWQTFISFTQRSRAGVILSDFCGLIIKGNSSFFHLDHENSQG